MREKDYKNMNIAYTPHCMDVKFVRVDATNLFDRLGEGTYTFHIVGPLVNHLKSHEECEWWVGQIIRIVKTLAPVYEIEAVKFLKRCSDLSLLEAKMFVDAIAEREQESAKE